MTREEALVKVRGYLTDLLPIEDCDEVEEIMLPLEQQPCEDAISREAVLEIQIKYAEHMGATKYWQMRDDIRALPSVTPTRPTGKWIADVDRWGDIVTTVNGYRCSECNTFNADKDNFCPNCGARMEESEGDECR